MTKAQYISTQFKYFFWITLAAALIPLTVMIGHRQYLESPASPMGIISMELAGTDAAATKIANSWNDSVTNSKLYSYCSCDSNIYRYRDSLKEAKLKDPIPKVYKLHVARIDVYWDFTFILLYVFLAIVVICKLENNRNSVFWLRLMIWLVIIAGICDFIEDFGMLSYLNETGKSSSIFAEPVYSAASIIKFILLGAFVILYIPCRIFQNGYLYRVSNYITTKLFQAWRYRVVLGGIILFSLPLWISDQGQDLLINISGSAFGVFTYLFVLTLSAFLNWWLAKLFFENVFQWPVMPFIEPYIPADQLEIEKKASRFLGVLTFLSPACAMLQVLTNFKIHYNVNFFSPILWLIILIAIFYFLIRYDLIDKWFQNIVNTTQKKHAILVTAVLLIVLLIIAAPLIMGMHPGKNTDLGRSPLILTYIALDLVLLALVFLITVTLRNELVPATWHWLREKIGIPIYTGAIIVCLGFLSYNIFPLGISASRLGEVDIFLFAGIILRVCFLYPFLYSSAETWKMETYQFCRYPVFCLHHHKYFSTH